MASIYNHGMDTIHIEIKSRIFQSGVTQEQVARVMSIEASLFSRILRGLRPMPAGFEDGVIAALALLGEAERAAREARESVLRADPACTNQEATL